MLERIAKLQLSVFFAGSAKEMCIRDRSYIGCNIRLDNAVCYAKAFSVILIAFNFFNAYHNYHSVLISFAVYSSPHGSTRCV